MYGLPAKSGFYIFKGWKQNGKQIRTRHRNCMWPAKPNYGYQAMFADPYYAASLSILASVCIPPEMGSSPPLKIVSMVGELCLGFLIPGGHLPPMAPTPIPLSPMKAVEHPEPPSDKPGRDLRTRPGSIGLFQADQPRPSGLSAWVVVCPQKSVGGSLATPHLCSALIHWEPLEQCGSAGK